MDKLTMTEAIMIAKDKRNLSWDDIGAAIEMSPVWTASACLGANSMTASVAKKLCEYLELSSDVEKALQTFPMKIWEQEVPTDPLVYRFYEIMGVYGTTFKEIIQEKCGDGIMSAIDFTIDIEKKEDPKGDRIVVTLDGKFLPYKAW